MKAFNIRERRFLYLDSDFESKFNLFVTKLNFLGNVSNGKLVKFIDADFLKSDGVFKIVYNKNKNILYILRKSDGISSDNSLDNRVLVVTDRGYVDLSIDKSCYLIITEDKVRIIPKGYSYATAKTIQIDKYLQIRLAG